MSKSKPNLVQYTLILLLTFLVSSCSTTKQEAEMIDIKTKAPDNLHAEISASSDKFSAMKASGTLTIGGTDTMLVNTKALFGIPVAKVYLAEDQVKAAIFFNNTGLDKKNVYSFIKEETKVVLSRELILSLLRSDLPDYFYNSGLKETKRDDGKRLFSRSLPDGIEYFLFDSKNRLSQYQQKTTEDKAFTLVLDNYKSQSGYDFATKFTLSLPFDDSRITLEYKDVAFDIPKGKFDFELPDNLKMIE